jgi:hypothetical protein
MENIEPIDYVFWANIVGASAFVFYIYFMWMQFRGLIRLSPLMLKFIRYTCLFLVLMPVAARYHYSKEAIFYLSCAIFLIGFLVRLKNKSGV